MDTRTKLVSEPSDESNSVSVSFRRSLFLWGFAAVISLVVLFAYVLIPMWRDGRALVLPLDDVYIHFQYAKQIALGEFYVYNPGLPPSSGATSLLYPYLLSLGYLLGFKGLSLGYWALLWGTLALTGSCWLLWRFALTFWHWNRRAVIVPVIFALTGSVGWHYMSGMETGLLLFAMLLTIFGVIGRRFNLSILGAVLMAVTRPEGGIMAAISVPCLFWQYRQTVSLRRLIWVTLPIVSLGIQPVVNRVFTGSFKAAGSDAKSILSMVPADKSEITLQVMRNFGRIWWELFTGYSVREGLYLPIPLFVVAVIGLIWLLLNRQWRVTGMMIFLWLSAVSAAVATLDPAFWHFKRYQMPLMGLLFVLMIPGLAWIQQRSQWGFGVLLAGLTASAAVSSIVYFQPAYQLNMGYLLEQQIPMAQWLDTNTPDDAVIAVHDVGIMRYLGNRTTVDMVGLTTAGASESWRNGPGALAEFLTQYEPRPDYVASYTDALGLSYLKDTGLYGELLAEYPVEVSDRFNVALAGSYQGVWRVNSDAVMLANEPRQSFSVDIITGLSLSDFVDVADLVSEQTHDYQWENSQRLPGFPTEVYEMDYISCEHDCTVMDGGRRINGFESFVMDTVPTQDLLLVTRLHPVNAGDFDVYVNGEWITSRTIPVIAGQWLEIVTVVDSSVIEDETEIRIEPHVPDGYYMPYYHWAYQGDLSDFAELDVSDSLVAYSFFSLIEVDWKMEGHQLLLDLYWHLTAQPREVGDYRFFVHVYDDLMTPPIAQSDQYPVGGTMPPGNWIGGVLHDTIVVDLSQVPSGNYSLVLGWYDPATGERLNPESTVFEPLEDGRVLLDSVDIGNAD